MQIYLFFSKKYKFVIAINAFHPEYFFRSLHKWWAQYMESLGEMDTALQFYEMAQDFLSLVRVYCYCGNMDKVGCSQGKLLLCFKSCLKLLKRFVLLQPIFFWSPSVSHKDSESFMFNSFSGLGFLHSVINQFRQLKKKYTPSSN